MQSEIWGLLNYEQNTFNSVMTQVDSQGWNVLGLAARCSTLPTFFMALIEKSPPDILSSAEMQVNNEGWNVVGVAACCQPEVAFLALIGKSSVEAVSLAITQVNNAGWNVLALAACCQPEASFLALIQKITSEALSLAVTQATREGWNVLGLTALKQSERAFLTLIEKIDAKAIDTALIQVNDAGQDPLQIASDLQSETAFIALIKKSSETAISTAISHINNMGWNALTIAAVRQSESAVFALMEGCTKVALSAALTQLDNTGEMQIRKLLEHTLSLKIFRKLFSQLDNKDLNLVAQVVDRCSNPLAISPLDSEKENTAKQALAEELVHRILRGETVSSVLQKIASNKKEFFCNALLEASYNENYTRKNRFSFLQAIIKEPHVQDILSGPTYDPRFFINFFQSDGQLLRIQHEIQRHELILQHLEKIGGGTSLADIIFSY